MLEALTFGLSEFVEGTSEQSFELTPRDLNLVMIDASIVGPIRIELVFTRTREEFQIRGVVQLKLEQPCVRCLRSVEADLRLELLILVRPRESRGPVEELPSEGVVVHDGDKFSLGTEVREAIMVEIEPHPLCQVGCKGICPKCGGNRNQKECTCSEEDPTDARWAALGKLKQARAERSQGASGQVPNNEQE